MAREGRDYADVLAEAQARGYAEADPTADVEGLDAVNKLVILARLAFGAWIDPAAGVEPAGHDPRPRRRPGHHRASPPSDVAAMAAEGRMLRLLATARLADDGALEASVVPTRGAGGLAVRALRRRAEPGRDRRRAGRAGSRSRDRAPAGRATASAVLGDLVAIARGLGSTWAGARARARAIGASPCAPSRQNASRRRPAPATRPRTEAPVISPDHARPRLVERYRAVPARRAVHAGRLAGRGRDAARPRPAPGRGASACATST